jgi:lipoyl(octanoyl) transferase
MSRSTHWSFLGTVPYAQATALQERTRRDLKAGEGPERLLLLAHPHVYTLGRNASEADVTASREWLAARGVEVAECDRGGQVTYHGPGQLVGYPVINLSPDRRDVRRYMRDLMEVLVRTLADLGVTAHARREAEVLGVWVGEAKIASLGVHLKRWIPTHGFALNVTPDLSYFTGIVPCGLTGIQMTSVERLTGRRPPLPEVAARVVHHFGEIFERRMVEEAPPLPSARKQELLALRGKLEISDCWRDLRELETTE